MSVSPPLPANPNIWINPNLLQLVGLGTAGDPYLPDGRYLRWFFGRLLGFPRSGFFLRRHRAPFGSDEQTTKLLIGSMGRLITSEPILDGGNSWRFPSGITVEKREGFAYTTMPNGIRYLRIDGRPIALSFGPQDPLPSVLVGPARNNPAAYALLTIVRRERTGHVLAEGFYNAGSELRPQDRAAVGARITDLLPLPARDLVIARPGIAWLRSSAERRMSLEAIRRRHVELTGDLKITTPTSSFLSNLLSRFDELIGNRWQTETLLLHGGLLDRIVITGADAVLVRAQWLPTRLYAQLPGWTDIDRFFLPLTNAPAIYPTWTATPGEQVAKDRLFTAPPRALPAWDEPNIPPPANTPAVENDLRLRYLDSAQCPAFTRVDAVMRQFLAGELSSLQPQALVETPEAMVWDGPEPPAGGSTVAFRPFDYLYSAAADPNMARLLGLMTSDFTDPAGEWDYLIGANFPLQWLYWTLFPKEAAHARRRRLINAHLLARWQETRVAAPNTIADAVQSLSGRFTFPVISIATFIERARVPLPHPPSDLRAVPKPWQGSKEVQSEVEVSWRVPTVNFFEEPLRSHIFYALRRRDDETDVALHREDDETRVLLPITPVSDANLDGRQHVNDRSIPKYGDYTWRTSGMDLWGRFSPWAEAAATVIDQVPPLEPANVTARLTGDAADAPTWNSLVVSFDWTAFQEGESADVVAFEVHVSQGKVPKADNQNASVWGKLEHAPGALTPPLRINWPATTFVAPGSGIIATVGTNAIAPADGDGTRIAVTISPVERPFDAAGFARVSAAVRALDAAGNISPFAPLAVATRVDEAPPPPAPLLPGPLQSSFPDARGRSFFRLALNTPAGMTVQVMRASQAALLHAGGTTTTEFEAMSEGERVAHLKELAIHHQRVFVADHEFPYGDTATTHMIELKGLSRDWTVAMLQRTSKNGVRGTWPTDADSFAVIAVPRPLPPSTPVFVEARPGDREARLRFVPDPNDMTRTIRILRTRDEAKTDDIRRMKPVLEIDVSALGPDDEIAKTDVNLLPDAIYFYRAVAVGDAGTRSEPGEVVTVRPYSTEPPPAPRLTSVQRELIPPNARRVIFTIPRRDYRTTVFRRAKPGAWDFIAANGHDGFLDLTTLAVTPSAGGYEVMLLDTVPEAWATYIYFVRINDPRERIADSAEVEEN
jgi:hypothetical protein